MGAIRFTNLTGAVEIGSNCYLLEHGGKRILLDAGFHPKKSGVDGLPRLELIADDSVDSIILSHSHQDHLGSLPVAMRKHPRATVLMTEATRLLSEVMLHNSVNVMMAEKAANESSEPVLFTHREIDGGLRRWMGRPLGQRFDITGERTNESDPSLSVEFFDAGHILGSAGTLLRAEGRSVFYAGDVQLDDQTISSAATFPDFADEPCDVMIMESTNGERVTPPGFTRQSEQERFAKAIQSALLRGCLLIPLFALGKTQEALGMFYTFRRDGVIRQDCPIYIGGLGAKLTEIYDKLAQRVPRHFPKLDLLDDVDPYIVGGRNAADIRLKPGRIFALSSGMMTEKTLSNFVARQFLCRPENSIFFIGYADPDSPAGKLRAAKPGDLVSLGEDHAPEPLKCHIETFNFSAHSNREGIRAYVNRARPKKLILVHGDPNAIGWLAQTLQADLPGTQVIIPAPGVTLEL
jgi:Cft2 family RNA processing exonuclease